MKKDLILSFIKQLFNRLYYTVTIYNTQQLVKKSSAAGLLFLNFYHYMATKSLHLTDPQNIVNSE